MVARSSLDLLCFFLLHLSVALAAPRAQSDWEDINPPDRWHQYLSASDVADKRIMFIGDVHGCYDEMLTLLREHDLLNDDETRIADDAIVVFVGDIINKGPKNIETLRWVMHSGAYCTTGNHEVNVLESGTDKYDWVEDCTEDDLEYLQSLPWTVSIEVYGVTVVHAGFLPDVDIEDQEEYTMTRMRNIIIEEDGSMTPSDSTDEGENWGHLWEGPQHVPYGHDAGRGKDDDGNPVIQYHDYATGLDTRCVYGGVLSGLMYFPDGRDPVIYDTQCEEYAKFDDATQDY